MHIAAVLQLKYQLYPALNHLHNALKQKSEEFSAYSHQIELGIQRVKTCETRLYELPIGDTAVETEIKTPEGLGKYVIKYLVQLTGVAFVDAPNQFEELNTYNVMVELSGALNTLAASLSKIQNNDMLLKI
jgi:fumarate hydratase class II